MRRRPSQAHPSAKPLREAEIQAAVMRMWRSIPGFSRYLVSSDGQVWSNATGQWIALLPEIGHRGHLRVTLYDEGMRQRFGVHQLVLQAFIGPRPSSRHEGAHNDGNPKNNDYRNLRWATKAENAADREAHGTLICGEASHFATISAEAAQEIASLVDEGADKSALAQQYGISVGAINRIAAGHSWRSVTGRQRKRRPPVDTAAVKRATDLVMAGVSENAAALKCGISRTTLRRSLGREA